jgi:hypothetical protein
VDSFGLLSVLVLDTLGFVEDNAVEFAFRVEKRAFALKRQILRGIIGC